jgi:hypothetical protein
MAIDGGHVSPQLPYILKRPDKLIYPRLLDEIDACLRFSDGKIVHLKLHLITEQLAEIVLAHLILRTFSRRRTF